MFLQEDLRAFLLHEFIRGLRDALTNQCVHDNQPTRLKLEVGTFQIARVYEH